MGYLDGIRWIAGIRQAQVNVLIPVVPSTQNRLWHRPPSSTIASP